MDESGFNRVVTNFLTKLANVHIDDSIDNQFALGIELVEQLVAQEDSPRAVGSGTRQLRSIATNPGSDPSNVAKRNATTQPKWTQPYLGQVLTAKQTLVTDPENPGTLSKRAVFRTSSSTVRAVCSSSARTDLCGGAASNGRPYRDNVSVRKQGHERTETATTPHFVFRRFK